MSSAWNVLLPFLFSTTLTPRPFNKSIKRLTSMMLGKLLIVTFSAVKRTAHKICKASFFAPCGTISPESLFPPFILKNDIYLLFFLFDLLLYLPDLFLDIGFLLS